MFNLNRAEGKPPVGMRWGAAGARCRLLRRLGAAGGISSWHQRGSEERTRGVDTYNDEVGGGGDARSRDQINLREWSADAAGIKRRLRNQENKSSEKT